MKKVSIMITSYNLEDSIDTAINSVVMQEMPFEWELLIGDDGSSDSTIDHINKWMEKYPQNIQLYVMERKQNKSKNGTRAAKNRANLLKHASGEFLIFLDGDDSFLGTEKLKRQVEILESPKYADCSCVAHNIYANDIQKGNKYPLTDVRLQDGRIDTKKYIKEMYFHTNTILFRSCCKEMMLNDKYRDYLNDNFITFIILQYGTIYYLHDIWAQYNLTGEGLWTGKKRIYSCFRNIILYDLENEINPSLKYEIFVRHMPNFRIILKEFGKEDKDSIRPLVEDLKEPLFHYTLLMFKMKEERNEEQTKEVRSLMMRIAVTQNVRRLKRIPIYLKRVLKHS